MSPGPARRPSIVLTRARRSPHIQSHSQRPCGPQSQYWTSLSFKSNKSNSTNPTNQAARLAIGFSLLLLFPSCFLLTVSRVQCEQYRLYNSALAAAVVVYIRCALQQTWLPLFQKVANPPYAHMGLIWGSYGAHMGLIWGS